MRLAHELLEIDRARLRSVLLESLPEQTMRWGSHVTGIDAVAGGGYRLHCADGSVSEFDVLIGADGGRSRVRKLVTPAEPQSVGVTVAMMRASVVFPVPGGPQKISEGTRSAAMARRRNPPGPTTFSWPATSSRVRGRMRSASGEPVSAVMHDTKFPIPEET